MNRLLRPISLIAIGVLLAALAPAVSFGGRDAITGPRYLNQENVALAQRILVTEKLLKSGSFTKGKMDHETVRALVAFQRSHGIQPNGILDPETLGVLTSHEQRIVVAQAPKPPIKVADKVEPMQKFEPPVTPAPAVAPAPPAPPKPAPVVRSMPKTASSLPLLAIIGAILVAGGVTLVRRSA